MARHQPLGVRYVEFCGVEQSEQRSRLPRHSQSPWVLGLSLQLRWGAMTQTQLHNLGGAGIRFLFSAFISKRNSSVGIARHIGAAAQPTSAFKLVLHQHNVVPPSRRSAVTVEDGDAPTCPDTAPSNLLVLLGAGLGQRPPRPPSQAHMPSGRAKHDDAGIPQGQHDPEQILASGTPGLAPVALAAGMFHSSVVWKPTMYFQLDSTSHLQLPFKN